MRERVHVNRTMKDLVADLRKIRIGGLNMRIQIKPPTNQNS